MISILRRGLLVLLAALPLFANAAATASNSGRVILPEIFAPTTRSSSKGINVSMPAPPSILNGAQFSSELSGLCAAGAFSACQLCLTASQPWENFTLAASQLSALACCNAW